MSNEAREKIAHKLQAAFTEEEKAAYSRVTDRIEADGVFCGAAMKEKRTDAGLSLRETARRIGLSDQTMSFWESDTYRPLPEYAVKLAGIFGCRAEELYTPGVSEVPEAAAEIGGGEEAFSEPPEVPAEVCGADPVQDGLSPEESREIMDAAEAAEDAAVSEGKITAADMADAEFAFAEEAREDKPDYLRNIITLLERQRQKGIDKYGQALEDNHALSPMERFEYMKEEMADMLFYAEHLQRMYREGGMGADDYQRRVVEASGMNESELLIRGALMLSGAAGELAGSMDEMLFSAGAEADREAMAGRLAVIARGLAFAAEGIGMTLSDVMDR